MKKIFSDHWRFLILLAGVIFTAIFVMMYSTQHGVGLMPDSFHYIDQAKSVMRNGSIWKNKQLGLHWPPGYPLFLAIFGWLFDPNLSHIQNLNAVLFAVCGVLFTSLLYLMSEKDLLISLFGAALFFTSFGVVQIFVVAFSETLFMVMILSAILLYLTARPGKTLPILVASALIGLSLLVRTIGLAFLPFAIGLNYVLLRRSKPFRWLWFGGSGLLLVAWQMFWAVRNVLVLGKPSDRVFIYHPIMKENILNFTNNTFVFALNTKSQWAVLCSSVIVLAILVIYSISVYRQFRKDPTNIKPGQVAAVLCFIGALFYTAFLVFSINFFDGASTISYRMMYPVLFLMMLATLTAFATFGPFKRSLGRGVMICGLLGVLLFNASFMQGALNGYHSNGIALNSLYWQKNDVIDFLRSHASQLDIYTDNDEILNYNLQNRILLLPRRETYVTHQKNTKLDADIDAMCSALRSGKAAIAVLNGLPYPWYLTTIADVEQRCKLQTAFSSDRGQVYFAAPAGE